jgi:hypothetical protein
MMTTIKKLNRLAAILALAVLTFVLTQSAAAQKKSNTNAKKPAARIPSWTWPGKLDAVAAAPKNHQIVYEDNNIRVLQVISPPGNEEPVHTHQYKSTMWFTHSAHFIYYNYVKDKNGRLVKKDSTEVKGFPAEALNKGQAVDREGPHSIKNMGTDTLMAYRVEYKKRSKELIRSNSTEQIFNP